MDNDKNDSRIVDRIKNDLIGFNEHLIRHLDDRRIKGNLKYQFPIFDSYRIKFDFYINFPVKAIVEIKKITDSDTKYNFIDFLRRFDDYNRVHHLNIRYFFLIVYGSFTDSYLKRLAKKHLGNSFSKLHFKVITISEDIEITEKLKAQVTSTMEIVENDTIQKAIRCAEEIRKYIAYFIYRTSFSKDKAPNLMYLPIPNYDFVGRFEDQLITLRPHINEEQEKIILEEIKELHQEMKSQHYISAALRVGRTFEFISYALGRSWGVEINQKELKIINDMNDLNNKLKSNL